MSVTVWNGEDRSGGYRADALLDAALDIHRDDPEFGSP